MLPRKGTKIHSAEQRYTTGVDKRDFMMTFISSLWLVLKAYGETAGPAVWSTPKPQVAGSSPAAPASFA